MIFVRTCRALISVFVYIVAITFILAFLPGLPPYYAFKPLDVAPAKPLVGKSAPKYVLDKAEILVEGKFVGPESIFIDGDVLYTGVESSEVVKIVDKGDRAEVSFLGYIGSPCGIQIAEDSNCSRPLGVRKDPQGKLVFADINKGILGFDLKTGTAEQYFDGPVQKHADDLDIAKDGTVYYSVLYEDPEADLLQQLLHPTGKLMKYDPKTKEITTLLSNLAMANGIQLSEKEDFVLVNETPFGRVVRYYLKGPKAGTQDIFVDGLPGIPDNIRPNGRGGYVIALFSGRMPLVDLVGRYPLVQKILARTQWILSKAVSLVKETIGGGSYLDSVEFLIRYYGPFSLEFNADATIVEVDGNGKILAILKPKEKQIKAVTQLTVGRNFAYLGSYSENKIWKIRTSDLRNY